MASRDDAAERAAIRDADGIASAEELRLLEADRAAYQRRKADPYEYLSEALVGRLIRGGQ